jgi:hypothetical protein
LSFCLFLSFIRSTPSVLLYSTFCSAFYTFLPMPYCLLFVPPSLSFLLSTFLCPTIYVLFYCLFLFLSLSMYCHIFYYQRQKERK